MARINCIISYWGKVYPTRSYTQIRDRGGRYAPPGVNRVNDNDIADNVVDIDAGDNDGHLDPV